MIISLEKLSKYPLHTWSSSHRSCCGQLQQFAVAGFVDVDALPIAFRNIALEIHAGYAEIEATADEVAVMEAVKKEAEVKRKMEADKAHHERHLQEAIARYEQHWIRECGLLNSQENHDAVISECERIQKRTPGAIMSAALIDLAVDFLNTTGALKWRPAEPVVQTPPTLPPPPKIAGTDEDELDINESRSWILKNATDVQINDLARRQASRARPDIFHFPPMPETITRKIIVNASLQQMDAWKRLYGNDAIDARLQGRG